MGITSGKEESRRRKGCGVGQTQASIYFVPCPWVGGCWAGWILGWISLDSSSRRWMSVVLGRPVGANKLTVAKQLVHGAVFLWPQASTSQMSVGRQG